ncbi:MAG: queuosine precursor transporter [Simkaniaceae bacterium]|nr:queuosine precursor transporter [Simkaniaceae bacterium]
MNERLFFLHSAVITASVLTACRIGKSALITLFTVQLIVANLFVTKQIDLFGLHVTCTDIYTIGSLMTLNLLQEYHGIRSAEKTVWIALFLLFFFTVMSFFQLRYLPGPHDTMQHPFVAILRVTPRLFVASAFVGLLSRRADILLYDILKKRYPTALISRFGLSSLLSQAVDTLLFTYIGLYGSIRSPWQVTLMSYSVKVITILGMAPFVTFAKKLIPPSPSRDQDPFRI